MLCSFSLFIATYVIFFIASHVFHCLCCVRDPLLMLSAWSILLLHTCSFVTAMYMIVFCSLYVFPCYCYIRVRLLLLCELLLPIWSFFITTSVPLLQPHDHYCQVCMTLLLLHTLMPALPRHLYTTDTCFSLLPHRLLLPACKVDSLKGLPRRTGWSISSRRAALAFTWSFIFSTLHKTLTLSSSYSHVASLYSTLINTGDSVTFYGDY